MNPAKSLISGFTYLYGPDKKPRTVYDITHDDKVILISEQSKYLVDRKTKHDKSMFEPITCVTPFSMCTRCKEDIVYKNPYCIDCHIHMDG